MSLKLQTITKYGITTSTLCLTLAIIIIALVTFSEGEIEHSVGSGDDDFWIEYPLQHPNSGNAVPHPDWVLVDLKERPVLILDHKIGCGACVKQEGYIEEALLDAGNRIKYYSMLVGGDDDRELNLPLYDPNDGIAFVPLTIIVTLVADSEGRVQVGWHSIEGATSVEWVSSYVDDAISYYENNSPGLDV